MRKGASAFKKKVLQIFNNLKQENKDSQAMPVIPVYEKHKLIAYLRTISISFLENPEVIKNLANWRAKHSWWFPAQFKVTQDGTKRWLEAQVLKAPDRLLFFLETPSGAPFGHMGFYRFNFLDRSCEVDNIVRGEDHLPGAMTPALKTLMNWAFNILGVKTLYLKCFLDNKRAIALYKRCGFSEVKKIPLKKIVEGDVVRWEEDPTVKKPKRYNLQMKFVKSNAR